MLLYHITIFVIANHLFLAFLLFFNPKVSNIHNRLLAGQLLCIAYFHLTAMFILWDKHEIYRHFTGSEYIFGALVGPLIYLYTLSYIKGKLPAIRKLYKHFIMAGLFFVAYLVIQLNRNFSGELSETDSRAFEVFVYVSDTICWMMIIPYIVFSLILFLKARKKFSKKPQIKWLQVYFFCTLFMLILGMPMSYIQNGKLLGVYLPILTLVYYITLFWQSISTSKIFTHESPLTNSYETTADFSTILKYFEKNKPYTNQDLTIEILAEQMGLPKNFLSQIINNQLGMNFFELVNSYRIKEAQELILNSSFQNYTIDAIARESGFKSRTSFYEAFKKQTGQTPSEFRLNNFTNKN